MLALGQSLLTHVYYRISFSTGKESTVLNCIKGHPPQALRMASLQQDRAEFRNELILLSTKERESAT